METTFQIKNFRSLRDVTINLNRATFLLGPNGGGKTSIGKALEFLYTNLIEPDYQINYKLQDDDLISFENSVFKNETQRRIQFILNYQSSVEEHFTKLPGIQEIRRYDREVDLEPYKTDEDLNDLLETADYDQLLHNLTNNRTAQEYYLKKHFPIIRFKLKISFIQKDHWERYFKKVRTFAARMLLTETDNQQVIKIANLVDSISNFYYSKTTSNNRSSLKTIMSDSSGFQRDDFDFFIMDLSVEDILRIYFLMHQSLEKHYNLKSLPIKEKNNILIKEYLKLQQLCYIIPKIVCETINPVKFQGIRKIPDQKYLLQNGLMPSIKNYSFVNDLPNKTIAQIIISSPNDKSIKQIYPLFKFDKIFSILNQLGLARGIYLKKSNEVGEIRVITTDLVDINIRNTSSGFLQLLPIIYSLGDSSEHQNFFIEQPELHLHPKLQAELADIFTVSLNENTKRCLLIETHSEHLIRRLQVLVAQKIVNLSEITIYYLHKINGETVVKEMVMDEYGFFTETWPTGFFDNSYNLTRELILARNN